MTKQEFYGSDLPRLQAAEQALVGLLSRYPDTRRDGGQPQTILYCTSRIKSAESMARKLELHGLPADGETAVREMHDAVGVRVICSFLDDVYQVADWLADQPAVRIVQTKDYISAPKPNGYRSLHLIVELAEGPGRGLSAEIQLRTIAIDFWASLEHQIKYKHTVTHESLIREELKRCADEIASVELSMQTIRELLAGSL